MCPVIVEFLVKFLEQEVCRLNWDVGFVTSTTQEIGVQLPRLLEVYDQLFKTRVCAWHVGTIVQFVLKCVGLRSFHPVTCLVAFSPAGSLLAAPEETSPPGGVHPRASLGICG